MYFFVFRTPECNSAFFDVTIKAEVLNIYVKIAKSHTQLD